MRELLLYLATSAPLADPAASATVKAAFVAAVAAVLAATLPSLLGRGQREPKVVRDLRIAEERLRSEVERDRDEWKGTAEAAIRGTQIRDGEIDRLRRLVLDLGGNPFPPHVVEGEPNA